MAIKQLKIVIYIFCCLWSFNAKAAITANEINELINFTTQQSHLCLQAQQAGDYAKALQISTTNETKLLEAINNLNGLTKSNDHDKFLAQLNYALSLVYHQQGTSYSAQGTTYKFQSDYSQATPLLKNSARLMQKSWELLQANAPLIGQAVDPQLGMLVMSSLLDVAETYQLQGQQQAASPLLTQASQLLEQTTLPFASQWTYRINLASRYQQQGDYPQAENLLQGIIQHSTTEAANLPITLVYLAQLYQEQQRYPEAEQQFLRSLALDRANPPPQDAPAALIPLASLYVQQQAYAKAEPLLQEALHALEQQTPATTGGFAQSLRSVTYLATREMLANTLLESGKQTAARELLLQTIHMPHNLLPPVSPGSKARSLESMAALHEKRQEIPAALDWLRQAREQYLAHPTDDREQAAQFRWLARRQLWLLHLGMAYRQLPVETSLPEVFQAMQQAHGEQRTQALRQTALRLSANNPDNRARLQTLWNLQTRLSQLDQQYAETLANPAATSTDSEQLHQAMQQTSHAIQQQDAQLRETLPAYTPLLSPVPLTLTQVQALLKPDEALLAWTLSDRAAKSWLLVIRPAHAPKLHALDINQSVLQTTLSDPANGLLAALADPQRPFNLSAAHGLYQTLLAPAADDLNGVKHIFAVPDGVLQNLPLQVLVKTPPTVTQGRDVYAQADWLANHHAFSYLPAVHALADLRKTPAQTATTTQPPTFIGFGDPLLQGSSTSQDDGWLAQLGAQLTRSTDGLQYFGNPALLATSLPALPETASELQQIALSLHADPDTALFLQENATESRLRQLARDGVLQRSRILSFASHALLPPDHATDTALSRMEPGLVLTPPATGTPDDDGYLSVSDIAGLELQADWVLLSACNTGVLQDRDTHNGLSALAKAFFVAGAKSVLASHWSVNSQATERLMTQLFHNLQQPAGISRAEALRQTMQTLSKQADECGWRCWLGWQEAAQPAHPAYWAAFVLYGEGGG